MYRVIDTGRRGATQIQSVAFYQNPRPRCEQLLSDVASLGLKPGQTKEGAVDVGRCTRGEVDKQLAQDRSELETVA